MARKLVAEAVIKAVDRFSGPMKRIGRHMARTNKSFARAGAAARRAGRSLGVGVTMPAAAIGRSLFGAALEFDRMRNSAQAAGRLTNEQIKPVELLARKLGSTTQFTASQAMGAARMLYKAGFDTERVMGTLKGTLDLAAAGELELADAADIATNVLTGMGMEMKTQEQATKSLTRVNDALAYAASNSNTDVRNLGESFKYAGPLASMVGASVEDLSAMFMTMASRGIKGSEAGVAVRSALVRMLRPTKAMQAALAGLNIDLEDFKSGAKQADAGGLVKSFAARGFDLSGVKGQLKALFADKSLQEDPSEFFKQLNATIAKGLGDTSTMGLDKSAKALNDYFAGLADKVDMPGFFAALKKAGASAGDISKIFDARQGARLATLVATDELLVNLKKLQTEAKGAAADMAAILMRGAPGAVKRLASAWEGLLITIAKSGVLDSVSRAMEGITSAINRIAQVSPTLLRLGTYAVMAAAVIGPLALAFGALAPVVGVVGTALAAVASPIGLVVAGAAALAYGAYKIYQNWDQVKATFASVGTAITNGWSRIKQAFARLGEEFMAPLKRNIADARLMFSSGWDTVVAGLNRAWSSIAGAFQAGYDRIKAVIMPIINLIKSVKSAIGGALGAVGRFVGLGGGKATAPRLAGARARGGPVRAGGLYLVGERGPEIVQMAGSGTVIPNHRLNKMPFSDDRDPDDENRPEFAPMGGLGNIIPNPLSMINPVRRIKTAMGGALGSVGRFLLSNPGADNAFEPGDAGPEIMRMASTGEAASRHMPGHAGFPTVFNRLRAAIMPAINMIRRVRFSMAGALKTMHRSVFSGGGTRMALKLAGAHLPVPREKGGPVRGGQTYLVGERGPELFQPSGGGAIVPNHAMRGFDGGGVNITAPVTIKMVIHEAGNGAEIARQAGENLRDELRDAFNGAISDTGIA